MHRLAGTLSAILVFAVAAFAQDGPEEIQVGYALVTPAFPETGRMAVFARFLQARVQDTVVEAVVLPPNLMTNALVPVDVSRSLSRNVGLAITNPNNGVATITLIVRRSNGTEFSTATVTIPTRRQISKLVTELFPIPAPGTFSTQAGIPAEFTGTLAVTSSIPVSILALGFRGPNYSTIPVTDLAPTNLPIPIIAPGAGGLGSVLLPQFVTGDIWDTEIEILNTTASSLTVRLDVFSQEGIPLTVTLNGATASSFTNLNIPANGALTLGP